MSPEYSITPVTHINIYKYPLKNIRIVYTIYIKKTWGSLLYILSFLFINYNTSNPCNNFKYLHRTIAEKKLK
jgi:hypothetical protein